jgi:hypothetical protein
MLDPKEVFIEEHERLAAQLEERGVPFAEALERTADQAHSAMTERFADMADHYRDLAKERR